MSEEQKRKEIAGMFDRIAWRYDFLNHFLSLGTDIWWRRKAISAIANLVKPERILDVATGTGDMAIAALRLNPLTIKGIDISEQMLQRGRQKLIKKGLTKRIELVQAASEQIPYPDESFDVAMSSFGVRNFSDTLKGLTEMNRVLIPGGVIMVLEFSKPSSFPFRQVYGFYFNSVLPFFGRLLSRDSSAYTYLPDSVSRFPQDNAFLRLLVDAGFGSAEQKRLSGGIATIYTAIKTERNN
jgi:demethylmenaquinone methyltransferase / 2-methoxy-6-polyprenyl-1,4-benzoquinol methylase